MKPIEGVEMLFGYVFGLRRDKKRLEEAMAHHDRLMNETLQLFNDIHERAKAETAKYDHIFSRFEK